MGDENEEGMGEDGMEPEGVAEGGAGEDGMEPEEPSDGAASDIETMNDTASEGWPPDGSSGGDTAGDDTAPDASDTSDDGAASEGEGDEPDFSGAQSSASGVESLSLEVSLLGIAAVEKIASEIARLIEPVAYQRGLKGVVIADPGSIGMLRTHSALMSELAGLETKLAATAPSGDGSDGGMEAGLVETAAINAAIGGVRSVARNVASALKVFRISSTYRGADPKIQLSVLHAALAKHVAGRGLEAQVPRYSVARESGSEFIDRLLRLQARSQELLNSGNGPSDISDIATRIGSLVLAVFGTTNAGDSVNTGAGSTLLQQLAEAEMLAAAVAQGFGLLTVEFTASGGSYRTRKWIFNTLLGRDGLTYSGGAAVTFFLLAGDSMAALASDTVYYASPYGSFGNKYETFSSTNIPGQQGY